MSQILLSIATWASGTIDGAVPASVITSSGLPPGLTIDSATRTWSYNGVGPVSSGTLSLIETKAGATGSPYTTSIGYSVVTPGTLSAPVLTKTSASGAALEWDIALAADIYEGYYLVIETSADGVTNLDGTYTTTTQVVEHVISPADYASGTISNADLVADGYADRRGLVYLHAYVYRDDGTTSLISNQISDTVTASVATLQTTTGTGKSSFITTSGTPALVATMNGNPGVTRLVRTETPADSDDFHVECTILGFTDRGPNGQVLIGFGDGTNDLNHASSGYPVPGVASVPGLGIYVTKGSTALKANRQATAGVTIATLGANPAVGDIIVLDGKKSTNQVTVKYYTLATTTLSSVLATITLSGAYIPTNYYANLGGMNNNVAGGASGDSGQVNFGKTAFIATPTAGAGTIYG